MSKATISLAPDAIAGRDLDDAPDNELLQIYTKTGDAAAAEILVHRYAAMVATVCRATVSDYQSAEDAFQITFAVLLQSAHSIRSGTSVGAWLHSVAYRSACRVRKKLMRDGHQEFDESKWLSTPVNRSSDPAELIARQVELETLSEELERLPHRLRTVIVEHHLLGRSAPEIAQELNVALTTVEGRLRRGRQVLRRQLASRGISMSTLIASSRFMQRSLAGCDASTWTQTFVQGGLSLHGRAKNRDSRDESRKLDRSDLLEISSQLLKDSSMLNLPSWKLLSGIAITCGLGVTAACFAASGIGGGSPQRASNAKMTLESAPAANTKAQLQLPGVTSPIADLTPQPTGAWKRPEGGVVPRWAKRNSEEEQAAEFYERVQEQLSVKILPSFPGGQPLSTVVTTIADMANIPIWINEAELEAFGLAVDTPVSLDIPKEVSLRSALRIMLAPLELTYIPRNEVLEITSISDAQADLMTREYDLAYLLPNASSVEAIHKLIHFSVHPDTWAMFGGNGSIVQIGSLMVVNAPYSTHESVEELLAKLSRMNPSNALQSSGFNTLDDILPQP